MKNKDQSPYLTVIEECLIKMHQQFSETINKYGTYLNIPYEELNDMFYAVSSNIQYDFEEYYDKYLDVELIVNPDTNQIDIYAYNVLSYACLYRSFDDILFFYDPIKDEYEDGFLSIRYDKKEKKIIVNDLLNKECYNKPEVVRRENETDNS